MIRNRIKELRLVRPDEVRPNAKNWRAHPQNQRDALRGVLAQVGIAAPVIAYETPEGLTLIDGHERMTVGVPFPCVILDVSEEEADVLLATFDPIGELATANQEKLAEILNDTAGKVQAEAVRQMLDDLRHTNGLSDNAPPTVDEILEEYHEEQRQPLGEPFAVPPCSVFDTSQEGWRERKLAWIASGSAKGGGVDPVLIEVATRWFTPAAGCTVVDPLATNETIREVVTHLGHRYIGHREPVEGCDLIFTVVNLPNVHDEDVTTTFRETIRRAVGTLGANRFAVCVVRDTCDLQGYHVSMVAEVVEAFRDTGMPLYQSAIVAHDLAEPTVGEDRSADDFATWRRLRSTHQHLLAFYHGDPRAIRTYQRVVTAPVQGTGDSAIAWSILHA